VIQAVVKLGRTGVRTIPLLAIAIVAAALSFLGIGPVLVLVLAGLASAAAWAIKNWGPRMGSWGTTGILNVGTLKIVGIPKVVAGVMAVAAVGAAIPVGLVRLFLSFLKIGSVMFGSGMVLLAFLQTEFVERLHWLTEKQLLDAVAVGQFTPGPLSATATFIGYLVAGWLGAVVATVGIFLPGFVLVAVSGPFLPRLRRSPVVAAALDGVAAGSLALMAVVAWQLGKASIVNWTMLLVFGASLIALLRFRVNSAWVIAAAAGIGFMLR
jgi:chromate transporter